MIIKRFKTVFVSDTHIGMRYANTKAFLKFLKSFDCDTLYLVGNIIDGWSLKRRWKWNKINTKIIKEIIDKHTKGTKIIFIPGNHDEFFRKFLDLQLYSKGMNNFKIVDEDIFYSVDGKKYLIIHGDQFDSVMVKQKWLAKIGDIAYDAMFGLNYILNLIRWLLGKPYWSIAQWSKDTVKGIVNFINKFERLLTNYAKENQCDGVICGHIHHAVIKNVNGIKYINCGDWVESLTAITEDFNGEISILEWDNQNV